MIVTKEKNFMEKKVNLFLDSGAFSAWSKGVKIDIDEYIAFIKKHKKYLEAYAVLDEIGDPVKTLENQKYMESKGLSPLPCFHYGEDIKYLKEYVENYDYIALGGMVPISTTQLIQWLDMLFTEYLCNAKGMPRLKVHGFGLTSIPLLIRYPWYSVDSTSWVLTGRFGAVFVPKKKGNQYLYNEIPLKINVSNRSSKVQEAGQHITTFSQTEKKVIFSYFEEKGFSLGKSEFGSDGKEIIIEAGLSNDYKKRDELNIFYFLDLEKNLPQWPWAFKCKQVKGFCL